MMLGSDSAPDLVIAPATGVYQAAAARLEAPIALRILEVGAYLRALSGLGNVTYRVCVWRWDGAITDANPLLGRSAQHVVSTASSSPANLLRVSWPLEEPVELPQFAQFLVGVAWDTDPVPTLLLGGYSGTGVRYRKDLADGAAWPVSMKNSVKVTDHDMTGWVEEYAPQSGVWVYRSGAWVNAWEGLAVRRGSTWDTTVQVKVRRSGVWENVDL